MEVCEVGRGAIEQVEQQQGLPSSCKAQQRSEDEPRGKELARRSSEH